MSGAVHHGRCLCGAVRLEVRAALGGISACHCRNCARWGGGLQMGIEVPEAAVLAEGPIRTHDTAIAERAWCDSCGSSLWLRSTEGPGVGTVELVPGLFEALGGARLERVVYADRAAGVALAGDVPRIGAAEYERSNPHLEDEA
ncbi:GFA family protein [Jannaschia sp. W003]|uniref:GFA family protein n=1 Tax=Jannaschia sp. W003 TaxID=2867012 RepID=UPI0021A48EA0|nr:GFA family protein [Jannaschia sp. W003]UWQ22042.1 GFA family protein [Jannaschia sp. W003]